MFLRGGGAHTVDETVEVQCQTPTGQAAGFPGMMALTVLLGLLAPQSQSSECFDRQHRIASSRGKRSHSSTAQAGTQSVPVTVMVVDESSFL